MTFRRKVARTKDEFRRISFALLSHNTVGRKNREENAIDICNTFLRKIYLNLQVVQSVKARHRQNFAQKLA